MNITKLSLICASILLASLLLDCGPAVRPVAKKTATGVVKDIEETIGKGVGRQAVKTLDKATKQKVIASLKDAPTHEKFHELMDKYPAFGEFVKDKTGERAQEFEKCLLEELTSDANLTELCFNK